MDEKEGGPGCDATNCMSRLRFLVSEGLLCLNVILAKRNFPPDKVAIAFSNSYQVMVAKKAVA